MQSSVPHSSAGQKFDELVSLMERLRAPDGCPWDREQSFESLQKYTLEETYEVFDAIDRGDWTGLREELGDYLLQAVFYAEIARDAGHFSIADSLDAINAKLIRRHPHVFGEGEARTAADVKKRWDEIKSTEKERPANLLDGVSRAQPALVEAQQLTAKAAAYKFDWPDTTDVLAKLREELQEFEEAGTDEERREEVGDLLFTVVNLARKVGIDAEQALRGSNGKFRRRFAHVESTLRAQGTALQDSNLEEMDRLWDEAKTSPSGS